MKWNPINHPPQLDGVYLVAEIIRGTTEVKTAWFENGAFRKEKDLSIRKIAYWLYIPTLPDHPPFAPNHFSDLVPPAFLSMDKDRSLIPPERLEAYDRLFSACKGLDVSAVLFAALQLSAYSFVFAVQENPKFAAYFAENLRLTADWAESGDCKVEGVDW